jgi:hypothetical protein
MTTGRGELGKTRLPLWAAGFVVLICVAILALSGWREWETRDAELKTAEVDDANLACGRHVRIRRHDPGGPRPSAGARWLGLRYHRKAPDLSADPQSSDRIRGIFVYDETGRWLATTEQIDFSKLSAQRPILPNSAREQIAG